MRQANNFGKFLKAKDLLDAPIQLYIQQLKEETSKFKNDKGEFPQQNVFYCEDLDGKERIITVGLGSSLFRALDELDTDTRDLLEVWTEMEEDSEYPQWRVKKVGGVVKEEEEDEQEAAERTGGLTKQEREAQKAGKKVIADKKKKDTEVEDEEITVDDLPF